MQFIYPTFLIALAAIAIPIILHLFYFRRFKKVYFTNVRFLKELKEETSARSKLRNLLVLLMRLLAIAFLVLAFAQPFIPQDVEVKKGRKAISVFVDNSFSMSSLSQDVPLLDKAKQRAREVVNAYEVEDEFQIVTNDFEGRHQRLVSQEDALGLIDEIKISPSVRELSKVLSRQQQALGTGDADNQVVFMISDFQKNITDIENLQDTTIEVNLVPLQSVQERNIGIDSAWFDAPVQLLNQNNPLLVRIRNYSNEAAENIRLSINYDGQTKPVGTLTVPPLSTVTDTVNITILRTGWHEAQLAITDYPVQFDDKYFFTFNVDREINVLVINQNTPNRFMDAAFAGLSHFKVTNLSGQGLDYSQFSNYQLIVVNELESISSGLSFELNQYTKNGGNLLVFPARNANLGTYKSFLNAFPANEFLLFEEQERQVGSINTEEFIFKDVFENKGANLKLPVSQGNFRQSNFNSRGEERLLTYRDGTPFLSKYQMEQGHLYICAAPLGDDYNNLVRNGEIFIPMVYKMAISSGQAKPIAYTIGRDEVIEADHRLSGTDIVYKLKGRSEEFIPEQRVSGAKVYLGVNNQIKEAGYYDLFLNQKEALEKLAFNFNRIESDLEHFNSDDLQDFVGPLANIIEVKDATLLTQKVQEQSRGIILWRLCLILVLSFLAIEVLLLRLWRV